MTKKAKAIDKVRNFTSLAEHDSVSEKEGHVTTQVFDETYKIRRIIHGGEAYYSVVDVVGALAEHQKAKDARNYWNVTKTRLNDETGGQLLTNCKWLKLPAEDGKMREAECADIKTMLRIVQSIPSKKAEPVKLWLAQVGFERIQEAAEPDKAARRMVEAYRELGYSDDWIEQRLRQAVIDTGWSEELAVRGVTPQGEAIIRQKAHEEAFGITQKQHRDIKGVMKNNELPDAMNRIELLIDTLWKAAGAEIMKSRQASGQAEVRDANMTAARIAGNTKAQIEDETNQSIITKGRTMDKPVDLRRL